MPTARTEGDLPDSCFAFVPSGEPTSARKLRLCSLETGEIDAGIVGAAAAALGPGYRGQKVQLPAGAKEAAVRTVRAAWRKVNPTKDDDEMPSGIHLSESGVPDPSPDLFAIRDEGTTPNLHVYQPAAFAEPPEWSPFLPIPGLYEHPVYGTLDYSPATYDRIVDQFKRGVYQDKLPVNAEHDPYASGAIGWIVDMRIADSGAIEAKVDWNERGRALIEGDRYLYVSAELMPTWVDPVDPNQTYQDMAVGLALTTHPYFKERVLPPLAASEAVLTRHAGTPGKEQDMGETKPDGQQTPPAADTPAEANPNTPTDVQQATDQIIAQLSEQLGDKAKISDPTVLAFVERAAREVAESRAEATRSKAESVQLAEKNAILQAQNRVKFFTDEVMGRGDGNGTAWVGDITEHVRMLCSLAEKHGPDSWELKQYVTSNRAHAEQIKASSLFSEIGTGRGADQSDMAYDKLAALAAERAKATGTTFEKAFDAVLMSEHDLRAAYAREQRQG